MNKNVYRLILVGKKPARSQDISLSNLPKKVGNEKGTETRKRKRGIRRAFLGDKILWEGTAPRTGFFAGKGWKLKFLRGTNPGQVVKIELTNLEAQLHFLGAPQRVLN